MSSQFSIKVDSVFCGQWNGLFQKRTTFHFRYASTKKNINSSFSFSTSQNLFDNQMAGVITRVPVCIEKGFCLLLQLHRKNIFWVKPFALANTSTRFALDSKADIIFYLKETLKSCYKYWALPLSTTITWTAFIYFWKIFVVRYCC